MSGEGSPSRRPRAGGVLGAVELVVGVIMAMGWSWICLSQPDRGGNSGGAQSYSAVAPLRRPEMVVRGPRLGRGKAVAVAALVVIAALVGALEVFPSETYSFQSPYAVSFTVSTNSTSVAQGGTLKLTMTDSNYLPFPNEPPGGFVFLDRMNLSSGFCGSIYPFGVAAYAGHYTLGNLSAASAVTIFNDFGVSFCMTSISPFSLGPFRSATMAAYLDGYWTAGETLAPGGISEGVLHHPFQPGPYTLVVGDAWGHLSVVYFQVKAGA
ncbi:MAG: hypothetical protein JRM89_03215 [Nitrososphaerota archaeon]|nr:hypothetical protein [Nitrososphaerota archaeon]MDG7014982.1 hypothetical protein [Nitrososphaerota archaeon]WGO50938.1 MAG: hypothetical protein JRM93_02680 [Nitrososphaerota archaeon]